jgi:hypothetical protein
VGLRSSQGAFFFLLQNEDGDLFKVTIEHEGEEVRSLKIKYFDTVPVSVSLCILKSGYLFAASDFSDQWVFRAPSCLSSFLLTGSGNCTSSRIWAMTTTSPSGRRLSILKTAMTTDPCHTPFSTRDPSKISFSSTPSHPSTRSQTQRSSTCSGRARTPRRSTRRAGRDRGARLGR